MTRHPRQRSALRFPQSLLGVLCGMILGLAAYGLVLFVVNRHIILETRTIPLTALSWPGDSLHWYLLPASGLGFIAFNSAAKTRNRVRAGLRALGALVVGAVCGALLAGLAYMILRTANGPVSGGSPMEQVLTAVTDPHDLMRLFLLAGGLSGIVATLYLRGGIVMQSVSRVSTGLLIGATAGVVIYVFAYVFINYPRVPNSSEYFVHFAEGVYSFTPIEFAFAIFGATVGAVMSRYSWRLYGIFALTALLSVVIGYLLYSFTATLPDVPPNRKPFALVLFAAEAVSLTMVVLYSFYTIDVATRKRWRRAPKTSPFSKYFLPRVAFHVPAFNEPPELVIDSLKSLLALDYPAGRFIVMVGDDSTKPESAGPLRRFCEENGIVYNHRNDRKGYKAGALNALLRITPEDVELIVVVDADYQVEREFLQETAGYFIDLQLAWVQTPQDYRNRDESFLTKQYYLADKYFYRTILPSRNEENSIIFCGTMGILRKQALVESGGWGEKYITEDAELSVRLLTSGWGSLYVNKTYGRGLIPSTFAGYKKQHHRWAFGGGQVMRGHFGEIFLGRFTGRQRFDYLVGNMHWFEGLFLLVIALSILAMGIGELLGLSVSTHHANEILLIGLVPWFLLVDGFTRLHMVLRRNLRLGFGGTIRVLGMWFSVKFSNSFAALKGLLGFRMAFIRTPKDVEGRLRFSQAFGRALRMTPLESAFAGLMLLVAAGVLIKSWQSTRLIGSIIPAQWLLAGWLAYYALIFAAAPIYAYKSYTGSAPVPQPVPLSKSLRSVAQ